MNLYVLHIKIFRSLPQHLNLEADFLSILLTLTYWWSMSNRCWCPFDDLFTKKLNSVDVMIPWKEMTFQLKVWKEVAALINCPKSYLYNYSNDCWIVHGMLKPSCGFTSLIYEHFVGQDYTYLLNYAFGLCLASSFKWHECVSNNQWVACQSYNWLDWTVLKSGLSTLSNQSVACQS